MQIMNSLVNLDFINIAHGISNTRIYRIEKQFFSYTSTISEIIPYISTTVQDMVNHITKILESSWGQINLSLNYKQNTYNKRKMAKLNNLLKGGDVELNSNNIKTWINFLI